MSLTIEKTLPAHDPGKLRAQIHADILERLDGHIDQETYDDISMLIARIIRLITGEQPYSYEQVILSIEEDPLLKEIANRFLIFYVYEAVKKEWGAAE